MSGPELDTGFKVPSYQYRVQGDDPSLAGHTVTDTGQDAIVRSGYLGTQFFWFTTKDSENAEQ